MDIFNVYVMGCLQILTGFHFFQKYLYQKGNPACSFLFMVVTMALLRIIPGGGPAELAVYILLLSFAGCLVSAGVQRLRKEQSDLKRENFMSVVFYAVITADTMQFSYGIFNSILSILSPVVYPVIHSMDFRIRGVLFLVQSILPLLLAVWCYQMLYRYVSKQSAGEKQDFLIILLPALLIFLLGGFISSWFYRTVIVMEGDGMAQREIHWWLLVIQILGMASLFCILCASRKLSEHFEVRMNLSLLQQETDGMRQYVQEAKVRYEKTKSFRHDVRNHILVVRELLQAQKHQEALTYLSEMEEMADELSFPCNTGRPAMDILLMNKLGIAENEGVNVSCTLQLPNSCQVSDIDLCICLSNALDNAICACRAMAEEEKKYIRVAGKQQGEFLLLEVENSFLGNELPFPGTGLSNIKTVAEKYHGAMEIKTRKSVFELSVLLNLSGEEEFHD